MTVEIAPFTLVVGSAFLIFFGAVLADTINENDGYNGPHSHTCLHLPTDNHRGINEEGEVVEQMESVCIVCGHTSYGEEEVIDEVEVGEG